MASTKASRAMNALLTRSIQSSIAGARDSCMLVRHASWPQYHSYDTSCLCPPQYQKRRFSMNRARPLSQHNRTQDPQRVADRYVTSSVVDLMSLKDRVVVITGAAKGIGLALAFAVAEAGGKVAVIDAAEGPSAAYHQLEKQCSQLQYYQSDVTHYDKLQVSFGSIVQDFGRVDGLITAAGICPDEPFLDRSPASVKRCLEINSLGTYYSAQLAARQMTVQSKLPGATVNTSAGSIVTIASIAAHRASKAQYTSDYCMSKGAVLSLTRQLGSELADRAIRVNTISPGYIMTDMTGDLVAMRPDLGEIFNQEPAMGRIGDRTDLKGAAVFLLSDASAYMTSGEMLITGGLHVGKIH